MIKTVNVNLTSEVHSLLKSKAKFNGVSMQYIAAALLTIVATSDDLDKVLELTNSEDINNEK